jgi:hypothetical protein
MIKTSDLQVGWGFFSLLPFHKGVFWLTIDCVNICVNIDCMLCKYKWDFVCRLKIDHAWSASSTCVTFFGNVLVVTKQYLLRTLYMCEHFVLNYISYNLFFHRSQIWVLLISIPVLFHWAESITRVLRLICSRFHSSEERDGNDYQDAPPPTCTAAQVTWSATGWNSPVPPSQSGAWQRSAKFFRNCWVFHQCSTNLCKVSRCRWVSTWFRIKACYVSRYHRVPNKCWCWLRDVRYITVPHSIMESINGKALQYSHYRYII